jgi:hypothetical protein
MSFYWPESCIRQAPVKKPIEKCSRCSDPIESHDIVVPFDNGDVIHVRCWRVGETQQRCRESRTLIQKSQKLIDESGRKLREINVPASVAPK